MPFAPLSRPATLGVAGAGGSGDSNQNHRVTVCSLTASKAGALRVVGLLLKRGEQGASGAGRAESRSRGKQGVGSRALGEQGARGGCRA